MDTLHVCLLTGWLVCTALGVERTEIDCSLVMRCDVMSCDIM